MKRSLLVLIATATLAGRMPWLGATSNAGGCPTGKPDCLCTQNYAPVVCPDGCKYSNACAATCAGERDCIRGVEAPVRTTVAPPVPAECPPAVSAAVLQAHPGAVIVSCKQVVENGKTQVEVELEVAKRERMELDVTPDGTIVSTERPVALSEVPPEVLKAFEAKYRDAKATRVVMQTAADGKISYEIAFAVGTKTKEATFGADGTFVEEE